MALGTKKVGLGPGDIVLDEDPAPPKGAQPQFSAHVRRGQAAGWIKMSIAMEVGLGPGDVVLDGDLAPMSIVAKRLDASRCHLGHLVRK